MAQLATEHDSRIEPIKLIEWKATADEWQLEQQAQTLEQWKKLFLARKNDDLTLKLDLYADPIIGMTYGVCKTVGTEHHPGQERDTLDAEFAKLDEQDKTTQIHPMTLGDYVKNALDVESRVYAHFLFSDRDDQS
jgi:hypothetical protein